MASRALGVDQIQKLEVFWQREGAAGVVMKFFDATVRNCLWGATEEPDLIKGVITLLDGRAKEIHLEKQEMITLVRAVLQTENGSSKTCVFCISQPSEGEQIDVRNILRKIFG